MKKLVLTSLILTISLLSVQPLFSHCEVPCGIYNDKMRCNLIEEHIATIEKAMKQITKLSKASELNYNQIVRWIKTKEKHAAEIQHIVNQYFMTQRVKPVAKKNTEKHKKYIKKLTLLHEMLIFAMKAKQTPDLEHVKKLNLLIKDFRTAYFESERK